MPPKSDLCFENKKYIIYRFYSIPGTIKDLNKEFQN